MIHGSVGIISTGTIVLLDKVLNCSALTIGFFGCFSARKNATLYCSPSTDSPLSQNMLAAYFARNTRFKRPAVGHIGSSFNSKYK